MTIPKEFPSTAVLNEKQLSKRGEYEIAPGFKMRDLYKIVHDRLEYVRLDKNGEKLSDHTDIDAICQNIVWVEVEKALGIYPNTDKLELK